MTEDRQPTQLPGPPEPLAWVLGARGLLGSAVRRRLAMLGHRVVTSEVPWDEPEAAVEVLLRDAARVSAAAGRTGLRVFWCAGAGVIGTSEAELASENDVFRSFLDGWEPVAGTGFFLASSAGGLYAGSAGPPFTEHSEPVPISPYGHAKLLSEETVRAFSERTGTAVLVGRLSNLYGPGQNVAKPQGLISQLCLAQLTRQPLSIYVSLDTLRDYLFVDDAAAMVVAGLEAVTAAGGAHLKVLASERSMTIGGILGDLRRITRKRPPVVMGSSPNARFQVRDLRLRSEAWPRTSAFVRTPLAAGMAATLADVSRQRQGAR